MRDWSVTNEELYDSAKRGNARAGKILVKRGYIDSDGQAANCVRLLSMQPGKADTMGLIVPELIKAGIETMTQAAKTGTNPVLPVPPGMVPRIPVVAPSQSVPYPVMPLPPGTPIAKPAWFAARGAYPSNVSVPAYRVPSTPLPPQAAYRGKPAPLMPKRPRLAPYELFLEDEPEPRETFVSWKEAREYTLKYLPETVVWSIYFRGNYDEPIFMSNAAQEQMQPGELDDFNDGTLPFGSLYNQVQNYSGTSTRY